MKLVILHSDFNAKITHKPVFFLGGGHAPLLRPPTRTQGKRIFYVAVWPVIDPADAKPGRETTASG